MKKKYFFMACLATIFMVSACNDDDDNAAVLPSAISNLTATPLEEECCWNGKFPSIPTCSMYR